MVINGDIINNNRMRGMNGVQLAEKILHDVPGMPVLMCSGYSEDITEEQVREKKIKRYINKPIDTNILLSAIKEYI